MKKQYGILLLVSCAWLDGALLACGGVDSPSAVTGTTAAALSCQSDSDCSSGYSCAHDAEHSVCKASATSTKQGTHACSRDSDCAWGYACATDVASPYCRAVPVPSTPSGSSCKPSGSADGGAPYYGGGEDCDHHGESCTRDQPCDTADAGASCPPEVEHGGGDSYYADAGHGSDDSYYADGEDDHGGSGRGGDDYEGGDDHGGSNRGSH